MERLLNISRPGGFPLCAETLRVLNNNSEMFSQWLKEIPLKNRQAVLFGDHLLVCQSLQKRWVKLGAVSAASTSQCKLVFHETVSHSVRDSSNNSIADVWLTEEADIVDESDSSMQWTLFGLRHVFELKLWYDCLPSFEAGLPGMVSVFQQVGQSSTGSQLPYHGLDRITRLTLYEDDNTMKTNDERARIKVALRYQGVSTAQHVIQLPLPFACPDGVRMDADVQDAATGAHYPIEAYTDGGALMLCVGRWLRNEGLIPAGSLTAGCDAIIRINKEVLL